MSNPYRDHLARLPATADEVVKVFTPAGGWPNYPKAFGALSHHYDVCRSLLASLIDEHYPESEEPARGAE